MPFKKLFIIFSVSCFLFLVSRFSSPIFAQSVSRSTTPTTPTTNNGSSINPYDELLRLSEAALPGKTSLERWSHDMLISQIQSASNIVTGDKTEYYKSTQSWYKNIQSGIVAPPPRYYVGGLVGSTVQMIGYLYTPAASGIQYVASLRDNLIGKPAYAQSPNGFGFQGLQFLLPLWKGTRNIAYVISTIIFVIIGLMIILRVKVSPQAVVTLQSAIPAIITSLVLITFSYAIAGFLIDLSNLIGGVVIAIIFYTQGSDINSNAVLVPPSISGLHSILNELTYKELVNPGFATIGELLSRTAPGWSIMEISTQIGGVIGGMLLGGIIPGSKLFSPLYFVGNLLGNFLGAIAGLFIPFLIGIVVAIWAIQMFFGMITCYVTIIFKVITGPLEIFMGAFPNSKTGFGSWFMDVFANVMVFPIITIYFSLLNLITNSIYESSNIWAPGPISNGWYGSDSITSGSILAALVGIGGLALASKLPSLIPQHIFMIKPSPFGQAIGASIAEGRKVAGAVATSPLKDAFDPENKPKRTIEFIENTIAGT